MEPFEAVNNGRNDTDVLDINQLVENLGTIMLNDLDIPSCVIVSNVPDSVFSEEKDKEEFQRMFLTFGEADFIFLRSFGKRVLVDYKLPECAAMAKVALHFRDFKEQELRVYFKMKVSKSTSSTLHPPKPQKQFLISPPASPPVGWEPVQEGIPVINYDLLAAVASMSPDKPHEIHAETPMTPGIIVHCCENPVSEEMEDSARPMRSLPREVVQTSRPPLPE